MSPFRTSSLQDVRYKPDAIKCLILIQVRGDERKARKQLLSTKRVGFITDVCIVSHSGKKTQDAVDFIHIPQQHTTLIMNK